MLAEYEFSFHYKPGIENIVVDALSRYSLDSWKSLKLLRATCKGDKATAILDGSFNQ